MQRRTFPLEELFYRLQDHGLPLGVAEYLALVRALQSGIGLPDRKSLRGLCMALWVKSEEDALLFNRLFDEMLPQPLPPPETGTPEATSTSPDVAGAGSPSEEELREPPSEAVERSSTPEEELPEAVLETAGPEATPGQGSYNPAPATMVPGESLPSREISLQISEPSGIVQAIRHGQGTMDLERPKYSLLTDYFPVTRRQMKQSWRYLRRPVREGPPVELDIDATVQKISREGMFREPVLRPRRSNQAEIALLIDQDGSMVPFHALSRQLIETVSRGGLLQHTYVYYFHDYPGEYLYLEPVRLQARPVLEVLMSFEVYTSVLIISDAGAARGHLDNERVKQTGVFLQKLAQHVRRFAWINPLPNSRWANTTAGDIARLVPMFDLSRRGLDDAINTLRGRYVYGEKLYPWMT